jgi:hypothetical protein
LADARAVDISWLVSEQEESSEKGAFAFTKAYVFIFPLLHFS